MFFYVKAEVGDKCIKCNEPILEWQSKDDIGGIHDVWGGCCERHKKALPLLEKNEVENYYTLCDKCNQWNEYKLLKNGKYKLIKNNK